VIRLEGSEVPSPSNLVHGRRTRTALTPESWLATLTEDTTCKPPFPLHSISIADKERMENRNTPIDYQSRRLEFQFTLTPYSGSSNLSFSAAQQTLKLALTNTGLETERGGLKTSGLDATAIRSAQTGYGTLVGADPDLPIPSVSQNRLTVDVEGLVYNADGT